MNGIAGIVRQTTTRQSSMWSSRLRRGSRNKFKYDDRLGLFRLHAVLPAGAAFPYDFGFVPQSKAPDGDPIDVLLLIDQPAFAGCVVPAHFIGVIEAEQKKRDKSAFATTVSWPSRKMRTIRDLQTIGDINNNLLKELEHFFISYNEAKGREFRFLRAQGPKHARKLLKTALKET